MKKIFSNFSVWHTSAFIAISAVVIIGFPACSKSSNNNSSNSPYMLSASKSGSNLSYSSTVVAAIAGSLCEVEGVSVSGSDTTGFIFEIGNYSGTGTYALGTTNLAEFVTNHSGTSGSIEIAAYGTLVITATSPNLTGTFSFTATDSTKFTNGSFVAKL